MPVGLTLAMSALLVGFERFVEWRFGTVGAIGLTTLLVGLKAQNVTCMTIGGLALAVLLLQSAEPVRPAAGQ
ncbi:hypothetical protein [Streptomyces sp. MAR4 CNX-425]|uniref:hypothetical protein n=1 Tax=Streptomyces sp. MAR4 CNX-425 TaxID=3406343 RepID=UPI003B50A1E5